jgi:peptidoglycan lytic transglycosylase G
VKFLLASLFTVLASLVLIAGFVLSYIFLPGLQKGKESVEVRIEHGDSFATVVRKLHEQKVISNERLFALWARLIGVEKKIHWGLYRFDASLSPREVLERMVLGKGVFQSVTIPEGLTVKEIADLMGKMEIVDRDKFLAAATNPEILGMFGLQEKGVEGYLFPDTYHFTPGTPEKDVVIAMIERFRKITQPLLDQYSQALGMTPHEILTLASIIEKETGVEAERPLVSAVFYNRLKLHMPLQSDPTVIYGLKDFNGNLTRKDLQQPTPYNTYRIAALPPGPICNPSLSSIKAAIHPAQVPYLYFVSKNDGTHLFSESLEAHRQAVKTYQPAAEPGGARRKILLRRG